MTIEMLIDDVTALVDEHKALHARVEALEAVCDSAKACNIRCSVCGGRGEYCILRSPEFPTETVDCEHCRPYREALKKLEEGTK